MLSTDAEILARLNRGYDGFTKDGSQPTGFALWAAQLGSCSLAHLYEEPSIPEPDPVIWGSCPLGHPLHEHALDHMGRCRRCVSTKAA